MPRLSQFFLVSIARRIAQAVMGLMPGPALTLIPIPVRAQRNTRMTRKIR